MRPVMVLLLALSVNLATAEKRAPERPAEVKPEKRPGRIESKEELKTRIENEKRESNDQNSRANPGDAKGGVKKSVAKEASPQKEHENKGLSETVTPLGERSSRYGNRSETAELDSAALEKLTREKLENSEEVVAAQKQMLKELAGDEPAQRGLIAREKMLLDAVGDKKVLDEEASRKFEVLMSERLGGKNTKEDIEIIKSAVCASDCGHKAMGITCRRITAFLKAAAGLTPIAFAAVFNYFMTTPAVNADGTVKDQIQCKTGLAEPSAIIVKDLTKAIPEETLAAAKTK